MGMATPLNSLSIKDGGIFDFGNHANPELLVKVLNGCNINNRWWVFYAATTNIGFTLTVMDTLTGVTKVYTNADLHFANAIGDTLALATCI